MDEQRWQKIEQIVDTALTKDKSQREEYILEACEGDKSLQKNVTRLLESIEKSGDTNYLEDPDVHKELRVDLVESANHPSGKSLVGKQIDQYKIKDLIGHGGMGSVYRAERAEDSYQHTVALKVMRVGMDTPANIARFKRERNILAKLNHPNIAHLHDGGITDSGLPYLVMEYVDGTPLYEYCDRQQLSISDRLDLFQSICHAVQHAHSNTVVHRDLKPSNILVTKDGTVKILDFGIAKLLEPENPEASFFETRTGARMLTFGYAAPEQVEGEPVTTATDSYTLGIILFELLAGIHPFDLEDKNLTEIEQLIRKKTPLSPSDKFGELPNKDQENIAKERNTSPSTLADTLKGDLDAIIMKALRKESQARYNTVEQFLEDLRRRKNNQPIIARKDTLQYKTTKFVKRHRKSLSVAAGFLLLIISFTVFYTWQITQERNRAQLEAEKAKQVSAFLTDMFRASNPHYNPKDTVSAATLLQRGEQRINQIKNQSKVQAQLLTVIGKARSELGNYERADSLLQRSLQLSKQQFGTNSIEYAQGLREYAVLNRKMGNFPVAESLHRESLTILRDQGEANRQMLAGTMNDLALVLRQKGDYQAADSLFSQTMQIYIANPSSKPDDIAQTANNWAGVLRELGKLGKAEKYFRKALQEWQEIHDNIHPNLATAYNDLAVVLERQGRTKEADSLYHRALKMNRTIYDGPHRDIAQILSNIGLLYGRTGNHEKALDYMLEALNMRRDFLRADHPALAESLNNLARLYIEMDKYEKARPLLKEALAIDKEAHGPQHPYVAGDLANMARIEQNIGSTEKAISLLEQSLTIFQQTLPSNHRRIGSVRHELGNLYFQQGEWQQAELQLHKALEIRKTSLPKNDWRIAHTKVILGETLTAMKEYERAEQLLKQGYQTLQNTQKAPDSTTEQSRSALANLYRQWDKLGKLDQLESN
ncbi:tetratricopeptide repeat protein [Fodinibius sp. AD559]|uniref:tetratricopeptide repeat protein n=1 Tax=Fodinibius sp. AD559 TaxID=3424179 RepID=UPI004046AC64